MDLNDLVVSYGGKSDQELRQLAGGNYELTQAVLSSHSEMAQDAGFELFGQDWAKRYWKNVMAQVSGVRAINEVYKWAIGASIGEVAKLIIEHYSLPAAAASAAVALAIILVRAARASSEKPKPV